jgi:DNA-binding Lrp family transcriptional regulator
MIIYLINHYLSFGRINMDDVLDEVDIAIIRALQKDARTSFATIAKSCNVSVDTISKRFKKIEDKGIARGTTVLLNPKSFGYDCVASFGIRADLPNIEVILQFLRQMPDVIFSTQSMGRHNIFAVAIVKSVANHSQAKEAIKAHPMVREVSTSIWVDDILLCPENFDLPEVGGKETHG